MTAVEIMERIEEERRKQGVSQNSLDDQTWHSNNCYGALLKRIRRGGAMTLRNIIGYADLLGLEIVIRKKRGDGM